MEKAIITVKGTNKGMSITTNGSVEELLLAIGGQIDVLAKKKKGVNPLSVAAMALAKYSEHEPTIKED